MVSVFVLGAKGKMGQYVILSLSEKGYKYVPKLEKSGDNLAPNVIIDFSSPQGFLSYLDLFVEKRIPVISGTTGFSEYEFKRVAKASEKIPILYSQNFSVGVNVMAMLAEQATERLKENCDIEIVEEHHRYKKDAPSGTARMLGEKIAHVLGNTLLERACYGREGVNLSRKNEIGFHSIRGGTIVGRHSIFFAMEDEVIELKHEVANRKVFAKGAVASIPFLLKQKNGLYSFFELVKQGLI